MPALSIERELIRGIVEISRNKEFYGHIVQQLERVVVPDNHRVQTAAVGRVHGDRFIKMYLSRKFFTELYEKYDRQKASGYLLAILEHEIMHLCFGHLFLKFQDKTRGAVAVDLVVNSFLPEGALPGNYVVPEMYGLGRGKSALWYYTHLQGNATYQQQCSSGQFGEGGILSHILSSWDMSADVKDDIVSKEFAKDIVRTARDLCGTNYGNIPGEVLDQIDSFLKKEKALVPWGKMLRMFVASCAESVLDYTVKRISRRYGTRPGTRKGDILNVAVAVDTSGSISNRQLQVFFNEIRWIWKNGAKITVYEADCSVCATYPFKGKFSGKVHGRGGTNLEPVLQEVEGKYDALIYFTDFYAPDVSRRYRIPTLWVLTTELDPSAYPVKWGKHIRIDVNKSVAA